MIEVGANSYGKSAIRLVKVDRRQTPHRLWDLTIAIALEGDFATSYSQGDNSAVIATDTMKNTAYALAGEHLTGSIEQYGLALATHFLGSGDEVDRVRIEIDPRIGHARNERDGLDLPGATRTDHQSDE